MTYRLAALFSMALLTGCGGAVTTDAMGLPPVEPERPGAPVKVQPAPRGPVRGKAGIIWLPSKPAGVSFTKSEVTVGQFRVCVKAGTCRRVSYADRNRDPTCNWGHDGRGRHPMNCVTWQGAVDFCRWVGGRLPTEKEWHAEASNNNTRMHPWGVTRASCARAIMADADTRGSGGETDGCGEGRTWPVCSKPAGKSVSGLCDMVGSVWEWTSTAEGKKRIVRGGGWGEDESRATLDSSARFADPPGGVFGLNGFRCARSRND